MMPLFIVFGILGLVCLCALIWLVKDANHNLNTLIEINKRVEKYVSPEFMYADPTASGPGFSEAAVEDIMRQIRGETQEMSDFLKSLEEEKDDEEDES